MRGSRPDEDESPDGETDGPALRPYGAAFVAVVIALALIPLAMSAFGELRDAFAGTDAGVETIPSAKMIAWDADKDGDPKTYLASGYRLTLASRTGVGRDRIPVLHVKAPGGEEYDVPGQPGFATPRAEFGIGKLDPETPGEQAIFTTYSGGAHCCAETLIAHFSGGRWSVINAGRRDGEEGFSYVDADGDGNVELVGSDNRFLYRFDSYASSLAPTQIFNLRGGKLVEVTREERFKPWLRTELARMEKEADEHPDSWKSNGFLAGWVAQKALVGEQADAWQRMSRSYDRETEWGLPCDSTDERKPKPVACNDAKAKQEMFPRELQIGRAHV